MKKTLFQELQRINEEDKDQIVSITKSSVKHINKNDTISSHGFVKDVLHSVSNSDVISKNQFTGNETVKKVNKNWYKVIEITL